MAKNGYHVIDSDMHLVEPADLWLRYMDRKYRSVAPVGDATEPWSIMVTIPGHPPMKTFDRIQALAADWAVKYRTHYPDEIARGFDAPAQIGAMDREGIDVAVMFPSRGLFVLGYDSTGAAGERGIDPDFAAGIARAYNDWLHDFCGEDRRRMYGAAMVSPQNVEAAVAETRRTVEELGFKAVFLNPHAIDSRPWHHPCYDPLWAECERLGVPVCFHGGGRGPGNTDFGFKVFEHLTMWHTFSHVVGVQFAMVSMIAGGVFDRFPNLQAGFLEGNCSWAPWLLWRMEEHYDYAGRVEVPLQLRPTEYFKRNCVTSVEADEEPAALYVQAFGDARVVFSTDFPHPDAKYPHAVDKFLGCPFSDQTKRRFLWDNCAEFYHLPMTPPGA
ncbi:MAG: amidohydrolase family protein [Gammaproteobacteria bacterium]